MLNLIGKKAKVSLIMILVLLLYFSASSLVMAGPIGADSQIEEALLEESEVEDDGVVLDKDIDQEKTPLGATATPMADITPLQAPKELRFNSDTEVYKLSGVSSNDKNSIQFAWIYKDDLYIAAITYKGNHNIKDLIFNNYIDPVQEFVADAVSVGSGDIEEGNSQPGSPLYINSGSPDYANENGPYYVTEFLTNLNDEEYHWEIFNLGEQRLTGEFTLELLTGATGHDVKGDDAIWHVKGALEIHKIAYDQYGKILNPPQDFNITVFGPNGFKRTITVTSGDFVLLGGLENGTYYAEEEIEGYDVTIEPGPVEVGINTTGIITVTNSLYPDIQVTIEKKVTGNYGDLTREFLFTIAINDGTSTSFKLSDGGKYSLEGIRPNDVITLTEESGDYEVTVMIDDDEIQPNEDGSYTITLSEEVTTITVENKYDVPIDTGISLDSLPYIIILVMAVGGLGIIIIGKGKIRN